MKFLNATELHLSFVFFLISSAVGFLVGAEFPIANSMYRTQTLTRTAGRLYALDLAGSWVGAISVSVVLIPLVGLVQTCILLAVIKLSSAVLLARTT